jgi:hypothetical protein
MQVVTNNGVRRSDKRQMQQLSAAPPEGSPSWEMVVTDDAEPAEVTLLDLGTVRPVMDANAFALFPPVN